MPVSRLELFDRTAATLSDIDDLRQLRRSFEWDSESALELLPHVVLAERNIRSKPAYFEDGKLKSGGQDFFQNPETAGPVNRQFAELMERSTGIPVENASARFI